MRRVLVGGHQTLDAGRDKISGAGNPPAGNRGSGKTTRVVNLLHGLQLVTKFHFGSMGTSLASKELWLQAGDIHFVTSPVGRLMS